MIANSPRTRSVIHNKLRGEKMNSTKLPPLSGALLLIPAQSFAQTKYPVKPIRMIVGYAPGGGSDIMGRIIAQQITDAMGQQVVVENRAGAAQNVAAEYFIKQPADGY